MYDVTNCEVVRVAPEEYQSDPVEPLVALDRHDWSRKAWYSIDAPYIREPLGNRSLAVKSQREFHDVVEQLYPWLLKVNMQNVCLAGGFCRSILLRQRLKDFDFFIYDDTTHEQREATSTDQAAAGGGGVGGVPHRSDADYERTLIRLATDLMTHVKSVHDRVKFLLLYKPTNNVFEICVVQDPNNFFKAGYSLDNFKQYAYSGLQQWDKEIIIDATTGTVFRKERWYDDDSEQRVFSMADKLAEIRKHKAAAMEAATVAAGESKDAEKSKLRSRFQRRQQQQADPAADLEGIENVDFSNYFEDGDVNGVHMLYRFQIIMTKNPSIPHILNQFDFYLCRTAWDGRTTFLTPRAAHAYRYMINVVNQNNYSDVFCHRLAKYFTYGFSIVLPELDIDKVRAMIDEAAAAAAQSDDADDASSAGGDRAVYLELDRKHPYDPDDEEFYGQKDDFDGIRFKINSIHGNCIMVEKNSHVQKQLRNIEQLEIRHLQKIAQQQAAGGDQPATNNALYISSLFCSLVSLLRYVSINSVPYLVTDQPVVPSYQQAAVPAAAAADSAVAAAAAASAAAPSDSAPASGGDAAAAAGEATGAKLTMQFRHSVETFRFIDRIKNRESGHDIYNHLRRA